MTPTRNHGSLTEDLFTAGFFRETTPSWLDVAALM